MNVSNDALRQWCEIQAINYVVKYRSVDQNSELFRRIKDMFEYSLDFPDFSESAYALLWSIVQVELKCWESMVWSSLSQKALEDEEPVELMHFMLMYREKPALQARVLGFVHWAFDGPWWHRLKTRFFFWRKSSLKGKRWFKQSFANMQVDQVFSECQEWYERQLKSKLGITS